MILFQKLRETSTSMKRMQHTLSPLPANDPLQDSLAYIASGQHLIPLCQVALLDAFFGTPASSDTSLDPYITHLESQLRASLHTWHHQKHSISSLKFHHLTDVAKLIQQALTRVEIENALSAELGEDVKSLAGELVELTVRVVFMVPLWNLLRERSEEACLTWYEGMLRGAFERCFRVDSLSRTWSLSPSSQKKMARGKSDLRLTKSFNAKTVCEVLGWKVVWTSNLLDHLSVRESDKGKGLLVFHHASFLRLQIEAANEVYPAGLLGETVCTLKLLLPADDAWVQDWYVRFVVQEKLDHEASRCGSLTGEERSVETFRYKPENTSPHILEENRNL